MEKKEASLIGLAVFMFISTLIFLLLFLLVSYDGITVKKELIERTQERDMLRGYCIKANGEIARANKMLAEENVMYVKQY